MTWFKFSFLVQLQLLWILLLLFSIRDALSQEKSLFTVPPLCGVVYEKNMRTIFSAVENCHGFLLFDFKKFVISSMQIGQETDSVADNRVLYNDVPRRILRSLQWAQF